MWLIMVLPSLIIWGFLFLGFQREYTPTTPMTYANEILGHNVATNMSRVGREVTKSANKLVTATDPDSLSRTIKDLATLSLHGDRNKSLNITVMGQHFMQETVKNPSIENILKSVLSL